MLLLCEPITALLAASVPGATPSLEGLRTDFRSLIQADVDGSFNARRRRCVLHGPALQATRRAGNAKHVSRALVTAWTHFGPEAHLAHPMADLVGLSSSA